MASKPRFGSVPTAGPIPELVGLTQGLVQRLGAGPGLLAVGFHLRMLLRRISLWWAGYGLLEYESKIDKAMQLPRSWTPHVPVSFRLELANMEMDRSRSGE